MVSSGEKVTFYWLHGWWLQNWTITHNASKSEHKCKMLWWWNWMDISKNIFACLFTVHNTISLLRHEQDMIEDGDLLILIWWFNMFMWSLASNFDPAPFCAPDKRLPNRSLRHLIILLFATLSLLLKMNTLWLESFEHSEICCRSFTPVAEWCWKDCNCWVT